MDRGDRRRGARVLRSGDRSVPEPAHRRPQPGLRAGGHGALHPGLGRGARGRRRDLRRGRHARHHRLVHRLLRPGPRLPDRARPRPGSRCAALPPGVHGLLRGAACSAPGPDHLPCGTGRGGAGGHRRAVHPARAHLQRPRDHRSGSSLFADGAAAAIITGKDLPASTPLLQLDHFETVLTPVGEEAMAWRIGDHGFEMVLGTYVPHIIDEHITGALVPLLAHEPALAEHPHRDIEHWAIHPGGPQHPRQGRGQARSPPRPSSPPKSSPPGPSSTTSPNCTSTESSPPNRPPPASTGRRRADQCHRPLPTGLRRLRLHDGIPDRAYVRRCPCAENLRRHKRDHEGAHLPRALSSLSEQVRWRSLYIGSTSDVRRILEVRYGSICGGRRWRKRRHLIGSRTSSSPMDSGPAISCPRRASCASASASPDRMSGKPSANCRRSTSSTSDTGTEPTSARCHSTRSSKPWSSAPQPRR